GREREAYYSWIKLQPVEQRETPCTQISAGSYRLWAARSQARFARVMTWAVPADVVPADDAPLSPPRRPEAARAALGGFQRVLLVPRHPRMLRNDELSDAFAARDDERFRAVVDEDDLALAPVVGVDGAGAVEDGDAVPSRQPAP